MVLSAGSIGGIVGAAVGGALGTFGAAIVSSPIGGVAAPLGTGVGAGGGFIAGSMSWGILGGFGGALFGLCAGARKVYLTQDKITEDSTSNLVKKIDTWCMKMGG